MIAASAKPSVRRRRRSTDCSSSTRRTMPDGDAERHRSGVSPERSRRPDVHYPFNVDEYAVPTLPSRSLADTLAFYERLGFGNAGDPAEVWDYMIIRRGTIELHFYVDD